MLWSQQLTRKIKHIKHKFQLIRNIIHRDDVIIAKTTLVKNVVNPLTKSLSQKMFKKHVELMCMKYVYDWF